MELNKYQEEKKENYEKTYVMNKNFLEDKYEKLETILSITINLMKNDFNQYLNNIKSNPQESMVLIELFLIQLYRTKKMRITLSNIMNKLFVEKNSIKQKLSNDEKDCFFKIMQFLDPIVESQKIVQNSFTIELIKNNTKINFITSNSPAAMEKTSNGMIGYMPLTPSIFLIITIQNPDIESRKFNYFEIDNIDTINLLNNRIDEYSDEIYTVFE